MSAHGNSPQNWLTRDKGLLAWIRRGFVIRPDPQRSIRQARRRVDLNWYDHPAEFEASDCPRESASARRARQHATPSQLEPDAPDDAPSLPHCPRQAAIGADRAIVHLSKHWTPHFSNAQTIDPAMDGNHRRIGKTVLEFCWRGLFASRSFSCACC